MTKTLGEIAKEARNALDYARTHENERWEIVAAAVAAEVRKAIDPAGMLEDGGPAFPGNWDHGGGQVESWTGMSLRDHFAGLALQAMISIPDKDGPNRGKRGVPILAGFAYEYADAMLAARKANP